MKKCIWIILSIIIWLVAAYGIQSIDTISFNKVCFGMLFGTFWQALNVELKNRHII